MNSYKIITDKDDIILKKKDNKIKLETKKKVLLPCNIIELIENLEIYNLFKLLNDKIINKCKILKNDTNKDANKDVILFLNNIMKNEDDNEDNEEDEDENEDEDLNKNFYITFTNIINKKDKNTIILTGKKNHVSLEKKGWKKIEIDNISIYINLIGDELEIKLTFEYIGKKIPIYAENTLGLVFRKIIKNLILYYSN